MPTVDTAYCEHCKKQIVAKKKGCNHGLHAVLTLFTGGFWLIIWVLCAITWDDWYCTQCGGKVKLGTTEPDFKCYKCGAIIEKDASFCRYCGAPAAVICKKCNTRNEHHSLFCKQCGTKIES